MERSIDDPAFGKMTWSDQYDCWDFSAGEIAGRQVDGVICPDEPAALPDKPWRVTIQAQLRYLRKNEGAIRLLLAQKALDYWEEMGYPPRAGTESPEAFCEDVEPMLLQFSPDGSVRVSYHTRYLLQHGRLWVTLNADCSVREVVVEEEE